ncbi:hypothetical protein [Halomonas sp. A29]|uniref:hypothetical protein n=1 Tax=Halomonas sp. A29 TaxID=3102786 RepID=UPI00398B19FB
MANRYWVYGLCLETTFRFRAPLTVAPATAACDLYFLCVQAGDDTVPSADDVLYLSREKNWCGEHVLEIYVTAEGSLMRFPGVADFLVSPGRIVCRLHDAELGFMVDLCLLGHVLSYYLEMTGVSALHAGVVAHDGQAVLFAADRQGGKSTLVASLVAAGFPLLADDIAALEPCEAGVLCRHAFPQLKLTPQQARRFVGADEGFDLVHPDFPKLSVPADRVGSIARESLQVARIYLLERRAPEDSDVTIRMEPLGAGESLIQLVRHSFLAEVLGECKAAAGGNGGEQEEVIRMRFNRLAAIARAVVVKRLCYPSGYQYLPEVHRAVLADLGGATVAD